MCGDKDKRPDLVVEEPEREGRMVEGDWNILRKRMTEDRWLKYDSEGYDCGFVQ